MGGAAQQGQTNLPSLWAVQVGERKQNPKSICAWQLSVTGDIFKSIPAWLERDKWLCVLHLPRQLLSRLPTQPGTRFPSCPQLRLSQWVWKLNINWTCVRERKDKECSGTGSQGRGGRGVAALPAEQSWVCIPPAGEHSSSDALGCPCKKTPLGGQTERKLCHPAAGGAAERVVPGGNAQGQEGMSVNTAPGLQGEVTEQCCLHCRNALLPARDICSGDFHLHSEILQLCSSRYLCKTF